ncbi:ribonuclease [Sphingomonas oleivorans]|uniref:Ribonuclease n=1 Tax=Sphingomonas oleivorans TaxID=1735121 RepID=A0A2T5FX92_9SPHN|nr:ribonuclease [Sphingomonas oleivorans]PTQ10704.1 ribonuclease [Sphingomonas oleivorans]
MAEWLYEAGIGEARAALVDHGRIVEMAIEREDGALRAGTLIEAKLVRKADATGRGLVSFAGGEALLSPVPAGLTEGARLMIEIVREAIREPGNVKLPKARAAAPGALPSPGPDLKARIAATGVPVTSLLPHQPDRLEEAGWSEAIEEAASGIVASPAAMLRIFATPAMTLIDVDGTSKAETLACAGAAMAGAAIRRFDIGGSIGIDLPTLSSKAERQAAAAALDEVLPQPFERTAVNGFGFLQIIRRRMRPSLIELIGQDRATAEALALLRRAERARGAGRRTLVAAPPVIARIERAPGWIDQLAVRIGAGIGLRTDPALAISAGHVETDHIQA